VPILVWSITPADEAALDRYEGFPSFYRKEQMNVEMKGRVVPTMIYIMNDGRALGQPNCSYYATIREGYVDAGFDTETLRRATHDLKE
jgi:hypothetical protein